MKDYSMLDNHALDRLVAEQLGYTIETDVSSVVERDANTGMATVYHKPVRYTLLDPDGDVCNPESGYEFWTDDPDRAWRTLSPQFSSDMGIAQRLVDKMTAHELPESISGYKSEDIAFGMKYLWNSLHSKRMWHVGWSNSVFSVMGLWVINASLPRALAEVYVAYSLKIEKKDE